MKIFDVIRAVEKDHTKRYQDGNTIVSWDDEVSDVIIEFNVLTGSGTYVYADVILPLEHTFFHDVTGEDA